jgi:tetratricopeptide (TPR) repeat protein
MWSERLLRRIRAHRGPVVFLGSPEDGAAYLIAALGEPRRPLVWVELDSRDADDPVSQGNKLADAVKRALGHPLFGYGAPYEYGLGILRKYLDLLGPFTFALSGAEHGPGLAREFLRLARGRYLVVLAFAALPRRLPLPRNRLLLEPRHMRLSRRDAAALADGRLPDITLLNMWRASKGQYEAFIVALHAQLSLPPPLRPTPEGPRLPAAHEVSASPEELLDLLAQRQRWMEALEVAAYHLPDRIPAVLAEAGHAYHERGLHQRLWELLAHLPEAVRQEEIVLFWRFSAALRLGRGDEMRTEVESHLSQHEAPDLRALYAGTVAPLETAILEAERAYRAARTPLTSYAYGRELSLRDPVEAVEVLRASVRIAEEHGRVYEVARNACALAAVLTGVGSYRESQTWAGWALEQFDRAGLGDAQRRLLILNDWCFSRILVGYTGGLEEALHEGETLLEKAFPQLARLFRSTLGDFLLSAGRAEEALKYYSINWKQTSRATLAADARDMVRVLLDLGKTPDALEIGERAYHLTQGEHWVHRHAATLAYGMVLSLREPRAAVPILESAYEGFRHPILAYRLAQAGLYLAQARLRLGNTSGAQAALDGAHTGLRELAGTGLRLLAGPLEAFNETRSLLEGEVPALELQFLGGREARVEGRLLRLPLRWCEILAALARRRDGASGEQLLLDVYGDSGSLTTLKAAISKLRRTIPIASKPYRLEVSVRADFLELEELLRKGCVREALALYRGPLLPASDAEAVVEARHLLEASLRQAVLASGDAQLLASLARLLGDDLEVWQAALHPLPNTDPEYPLVRARVEQLRRA